MLQESPLYAYFPARDLERARKFYEQTLGLVPQQEMNGGVVYAFAGGTAAFLYPTPNAGTSKASQAFWSVEDVDREIETLKGRGVTFGNTTCPATAALQAPSSPGARRPHGSRTARGISLR